MKNRSLFVLLVAIMSVFVARTASADPPSLDACLNACASKIHACVQEMEYKIDLLCKGVTECDGLNASAVAAGTALCKACAESATGECVKSADKPAKSAPPVAQPNTCAAKGGVMVKKIDFATGKSYPVCFTLRGANDEIEALKLWAIMTAAQIAQLREQHQPVPPLMPTNIQGGAAELTQLYQGLNALGLQQAQLVQNVQTMFQGLDRAMRDFNLRISNVEQDVIVLKQDVNGLKQSRQSPVVVPGRAGDKDTFGLSLAGYWGFDAFKQYGEFVHAPGLELGIFRKLNVFGLNNFRVTGFAGGGLPGASTYGGKNMYEWHAGAGFMHKWQNASIGYGALFMQRRDTDHHYVASTFVGGYVEPRAYIIGGLFLGGRLGVGNRHAQGQTQNRTTDKLDVNLSFSLGYEISSW